MPWPFCTTSTVIASGTTSSAIAAQENAGTCSRGAASTAACSRPGAKVPDLAMTRAPAAERHEQRRQARGDRRHAR